MPKPVKRKLKKRLHTRSAAQVRKRLARNKEEKRRLCTCKRLRKGEVCGYCYYEGIE